VESETYRPFWAGTRHADVLDIERDHEHFRNAPRPLLVPTEMEARAEASGQMLRTLIHMDDTDHKAFAASRPAGSCPAASGRSRTDPRARRSLHRARG